MTARVPRTLNKINYIENPELYSKDDKETFKCMGKWKQWMNNINVNFDSTKSFFVVLMEGQVVLDFDVITPDKIQKDKKDKYKNLNTIWLQRIMDGDVPDTWESIKEVIEEFGLPTDDTETYIIKTGSGGYHYYCVVDIPQQFIFGNTSGERFYKNLSIDSRTKGGLLFGVGTKWKDRNTPYTMFKGTEDSMPSIDGWRIAAITGKLDHELFGINLFKFLDNKVSIHDEERVKGKNEFAVWQEVMFFLKSIGYSKNEILNTFSCINGFDQKVCEVQINAHWEDENHPNRILPSKVMDKKDKVKDSKEALEEAKKKIEELDVDNYTDDDIKTIIGLGNPNDMSLHKRLSDLLKDKINLTRIEYNKILKKVDIEKRIQDRNIASNTSGITTTTELQEDEWTVRVHGEQTRNSMIDYVLTPSSVFQEKFTVVGGEILPVPVRTEIWKMKDFKIDTVLIETTRYETNYRYIFKYKGNMYRDKTFTEMKEDIAQTSLMQSKYKQIFGVLIDEYIQQQNIPKMPYSPVLGFTIDGWRFPDKYYIKATTAIQKEVRDNIEGIFGLTIDEAQANEYMKLIYNAVSLKYKDVLFAYSMVSPFLYALRSYTDLICWVSLGSDEGGTGKTKMCELMTKKIWNNYDILSKDNFSSFSRAGDYLSTSTFALVIDDCQDLMEQNISLIKTYITQEIKMQRKGADQTLVVDKSVTAPLIVNFNSIPEMFNDTPFLSRGIHIPTILKFVMKDKEKFEKIKKIKDGYIGRYIINKTEAWNLDNILDLYNKTIKFDEWDDIRANTIYRLLQTGAMLFKMLFGIDLNLSDVEHLIRKTRELGSDDVFTIIQFQLVDAVKKQDNEGNWTFKPSEKWIQSEIEPRIKEGSMYGYYFTINNVVDLNRRLNIKKQSLNTLYEKLKNKWNDVKLVTYVNGKLMRAIYIPINASQQKPANWNKVRDRLEEKRDKEDNDSKKETIIETKGKNDAPEGDVKTLDICEDFQQSLMALLHVNGGSIVTYELFNKLRQSIGIHDVTEPYQALYRMRDLNIVKIEYKDKTEDIYYAMVTLINGVEKK